MATVRWGVLGAAVLATLHAAAAKADPPVATTPRATAEPASAQAEAQAERLLTEGRELFAQGKSEAALEKLRAAWALHRSYAIAANLGSAELDLGRMRDAAEHFDFALREMPASVEKAKRDAVSGYLQKARAAIGALRVQVEPAGARVLVDGDPAGTAPLPGELFVEPGQHAVAAQADGFAPKGESVTVAAGEAKAVSLRLSRAVAVPSATPGPPPPPRVPDDRAPQMAIWVLVGAAAVVAGTYSLSIGVDVRSKIPDRTASDVVIGIGASSVLLGLGTGIGGVLYERTVRWPQTAAVGVAPWVGAHGGGACVAGTF